MKQFAAALIGAALTVAGSAASAAPLQLRLTQGATAPVTVADNGIGDLNPTDGVILFNGTIGSYLINTSIGVGELPAFFPTLMDLASINGGSGELTIELTQTGLSAGSNPFYLNAAIGGTTSGTVAYSLFADSTDTAFGTETLIFSGTSSSNPFGDSGFGLFSDPSGTFSLYQRVVLNHAGLGFSSFDFETRIPEPGTAALLGAALLGLGFAQRSRKRA